MTSPMYNTKNAGVKRLMKEASELSDPTEMFYAQPLEDNLFEWHFTVRGPLDSDFDGGIYHGKILFPPDYPMKPPNLIILTPNGRFELNKKICLSISGYHPETWLPSWSIRTALLALIGFMPSEPGGALGSLQYPPAERKKLAKASLQWTCKECGLCMKNALLELTEDGKASNSEAKELASKLNFKDESEKLKPEENKATSGSEPAAEPPVAQESASPPPPPAVRAAVTRPRRTTSNDNCDMLMFVYVPLCVVSFSVFLLLLARRFLI